MAQVAKIGTILVKVFRIAVLQLADKNQAIPVLPGSVALVNEKYLKGQAKSHAIM
jgi:hypothetical protein